ncbi:MAG: HAD-IA family hydrolase [Clostridia bacterium]|nr:HAD-IA family hydrolase [Clostridia bacterium]
MKIQGVLFDMDGVLIDSEPFILEAAIQGLKQFGVNAQPDDFTPYIGAGETKYLGGPAEKYGVDFKPEMKTVVYAIYADILRQHTDAVYDGVFEVISYVKSKYRAAVCSAADLIKVEHNLSAIGVTPSFFDALVTGSDVTRQKPFPDIFLKGAELIGIAPEQCVVVEDSINGIKAAKAAGALSVGITTSFSALELIEKANPDYILDNIKQLPDILEKIK